MTVRGFKRIAFTSILMMSLMSVTVLAEVLFERPWANFLAIAPIGATGSCVVGLGGEIWTSHVESGGVWVRRESGVSLEWFNGVSFISNGRSGWIVGSNGSVLSTQDGGKHWQHQSIPGTALMDVLAVSERIILACGVDGTVLRTENGGVDWKQVNSGVSSILTRFARVPQSHSIRIVGGDGVVLFSNDEGLTWQLQTTPTKELLLDSYWLSETTGFICGQNSVLLSTDDAGQTWVQRGPRTKHEFCTLSFCDKMYGIVAGGSLTGDSVVYVTHDGGLTWSQKMGSHQTWWKDSMCDDSGRIILVGNDRVIAFEDTGTE